ncbi:hypothetical protein KFE25_011786 [Diacronema lutheri]|uniref:Uncharacterized protein n=1 Tax=Diacronema lutheri TaxID=2081491 RepID=A0A8J6C826_DIALT|nr:hypothetical protein KFE25_011786 [Diacronema lutheri]
MAPAGRALVGLVFVVVVARGLGEEGDEPTLVSSLERALAALDARLRAPAAERPLARYALLVAGRYGPWSKAASQGVQRNFSSSLRQIRFAAASHLAHVVLAPDNAAPAADGARGVDVFVHSWNPDAAAFIDAQYARALVASAHQPLEEAREAARSFALSIGRVARLAALHESARGRSYEMLLLVRCDLVLVADAQLGAHGPGRVWLASHCCKAKAASADERALVDRTCGAPHVPRPALPAVVTSSWRRALARWEHHFYGHAFVAPCRAAAFLPGREGALLSAASSAAFFTMDWWIGTASSDVLASWAQIGEQWEAYRCALKRRGFGSNRLFSHFAWMVHVHDALGVGDRVSFSDRVTGSLARLLAPAPERGVPALSAGGCVALTAGGVELVGAQLAARPLAPADAAALLSGADGGGVSARYAPMARQCPLAPFLAAGARAPANASARQGGGGGRRSGAAVCCSDGLCGDRSRRAAAVARPTTAVQHAEARAARARAAGSCSGREGGEALLMHLAAAPAALDSPAVRAALLARRAPSAAHAAGAATLARHPRDVSGSGALALRRLAALGCAPTRASAPRAVADADADAAASTERTPDRRAAGGVPGATRHAAHGVGAGKRTAPLARFGPAAAAAFARRHARDAAAAQCVPPAAERRGARAYGFSGVHYVKQLRAWLYEVPKSGSTTLVTFFRLRNGRLAPVPPGGPARGEIGFAVARQPVERAISAFHTAHARGAWRANATNSPCPYARFPFLQARISDSDGVASAVRVLREHGTAAADAGCGFAYHHLLSQSWFLWRDRVRLVYEACARAAGAPPVPEARLPPSVSVVLRLEHLADDLLALCALRNASAYCAKRIAQIGGIRPLNPSGKSTISAEAWAAAEEYYAPDFECLGYERSKKQPHNFQF